MGLKNIYTKTKGKLIKKKPIDKELDRIYSEMNNHDPLSDEYKTLSEAALKLEKLKNENKNILSKDAILSGIISLGSIILILNYEKFDVIGTKAFGFIKKPK